MNKFHFTILFAAVVSAFILTGCGPYPTEQAVEVKNNETAFVVPLEGDTKAKQAQFMSIDYLEKAKVATKRIVIPLRKRSTGRAWFDYEWIPLARVIVVDRSPVTREWLEKAGIKVESLDSVGFTVGVNCTGMIREEDAAKFLYYYPGNSLSDVMNKNVKGFIQNVLAREFGSLKFYGSANSLYPMRKKAMVKKKGCDEKMEVAHIVNPNLVLFGTAVPKYFYESLSRRVLENGLVARCIIVEAGKRGEAGTAMPIAPADSLLRAAKYLVDLDLQGNLAHEYPKPLIITETPDATKALREIQEECDRRYKFFESRGEGGAMALWARAHEKICKLAMLHGISSNVYDPVITEKSVKWAWKFIDHLTRRMLYMADAYVYENVFDEKCQRVLRALAEADGEMGHSQLLRKSRESLDVFKKIIDTLRENGSIEIDIDKGKTKPTRIYRLLRG